MPESRRRRTLKVRNERHRDWGQRGGHETDRDGCAAAKTVADGTDVRTRDLGATNNGAHGNRKDDCAIQATRPHIFCQGRAGQGRAGQGRAGQGRAMTRAHAKRSAHQPSAPADPTHAEHQPGPRPHPRRAPARTAPLPTPSTSPDRAPGHAAQFILWLQHAVGQMDHRPIMVCREAVATSFV